MPQDLYTSNKTMENGSIESDKLKYTPIRVLRSKAIARKELKSSFLDFVCPLSSTPNIDSKSTNKPKYNKGKKNSEDTKNSETNKVREDTKGDKIHTAKMAPKLVINTKKNVIIGGSKESSEIIKATSAAGEQIKEKELEEEGEGNLATVFENKDLVSPVTDKESNQPDNVLDIDTLNKKIESIRLQMADSLNGGLTNILATINDISDKVNQNENRITSIENRVEKVEQYLADKIPDGGLLSLEKLVDSHQEIKKAKKLDHNN